MKHLAKTTEKPKQSRIISLDITRAIAVFLVVLCHATEAIYSTGALTEGSDQPFAIVTFTLGRMGVPFFLFITGALVLKKQIDTDDDVLKFYKKSLLPLVIISVVWVIIYNLFFLISGQGDDVTIEKVIREIFFVKEMPYEHMWYMPTIIGMYIGLPFIAKIVKSFSNRSLIIPAAIAFFTFFIIPFINLLLAITGASDKALSPSLDLSFLGATFGLYILVGYMLTNIKAKVSSVWLLTVALLSFIITFLVQLVSRSPQSYTLYSVWYNFPFLLICSACLFYSINHVSYAKLNKRFLAFITFVSKASLAIFFVHIITQSLLMQYISPLEIASSAKLLILLVANLCGSIIICYVLSKIKFLSKWVLRIK